MKRWLLVIISLTALLPFQSLKAQNTHIRKQLMTALKNSETTDSLYNSLEKAKHKNGLTTGYFAAVQALKAIHAWNPYNKIKYLNRSEKSFKEAVEIDPHNIEIRFMRFSVEHNVPGWLGYNKNLVADRETIIQQLKKKNYHTNDKDLVVTIIKFLIESKRCTPAENDYLHAQLNALK